MLGVNRKNRGFGLACIVILMALSAPGCGGGSAQADGGRADDGTGGGAMPSVCPQAPFEFEIRRNGAGDNEMFRAVSARADMQLERRSYKLYLTDYAIDPELSLMSQVQDKPPGGTVIQVAVQTDYGSENTPSLDQWRELQAGDQALHIKASREKYPKPDGQPIMTLWIATDQGLTSRSTVNQVLTAEVLYVGSDGICLDVNGTSESGTQISGVVAGVVH